MSKTFKLIIVLIFTTYHFSFLFCQFYSKPKIIYRPRKSGTWPRSLKINRPRKAFEIKDRKAFELTDIYTEKFLKELEARIQSKSPGAKQWPAVVDTQPRKNNKFPETNQKYKQEKNVDTLRSKEVPLDLEEPTKKLMNSQKIILQLKEEIRKEKQNKKDWKNKEESLSVELPGQIKPKELKSEEIKNVTHHHTKSSQTAVVEKNNLREGHQHYPVSLSRQLDHKSPKLNNRCIKKCYTPKCEVECSANNCRASSRGPDSAAVCKGKRCQGLCFKAECIAACEGDSCSVKCEGNVCHAVAEGQQAASTCEGDYCVAYGKGTATKPKCEGRVCQTWCIGDNCIARCHGFSCEAMCSGQDCKAQCVGKNCTQYQYPNRARGPTKPWVLDSEEDSKSEEISISDESNLATKPNKDDDDGYYGNKHYVKNTINGNVNSRDIVNSGNTGNSGNIANVPFVPAPVPYDNNGDESVTLDYSIAIQLSKRIGDYLKKKIYELKDLSLLRYLPNLI